MNYKVSIINANTFTSGLGRYANFLYEATKPVSSLINLKMDKRMSFDHGEIITGILPPVSNGWTINASLYNVIFNRRLSKISSKSILHYSTELGKPIEDSIATIHDLFFLKYPENYPSGYRRWHLNNLQYYKKLKNIISDSEYTKRQLVEEGFKGQISKIYPPVSPGIFRIADLNKDKIREDLNLPRSKTLVLVVASNEKRKNLEVVREISGNNDLVIVSVGAEVSGAICLKNIDERKLNLLYNACDLLLSPSRDEGFGFPVVEAMTAGLPVVASDIEVYNEITDGHAILVDTSDVQYIREGIKEAIYSSETLSKDAMEYARKYSFENFKSEIRQYYETCFPDKIKFTT